MAFVSLFLPERRWLLHPQQCRGSVAPATGVPSTPFLRAAISRTCCMQVKADEPGPVYIEGELDHVALSCRHVEAMMDFYVHAIGLKPERLEEWRAGKVPFPSVRINPGTIIDFFPDKEMDATFAHGANHYCISFPEKTYHQLVQRLADRGIQPEIGEMKLSGARGLARATYFRDPDGNTLEIRYYND